MPTLSESLTNPPLTEAAFVLRWALANVAEAIKYDIGLEEAVYKLRRSNLTRFPRFERRLPPGIGSPFTMNYAPLFRLLPTGGTDYPRVELGPGVFVVRQAGKPYAFKSFVELVAEQVTRLTEAYQDLAEDDFALEPQELSFAQYNRIDLAEWDEYHGHAVGTTLASAFVAETLDNKVNSPVDRLSAARLYRQSLSRTYDLGEDVGLFTLEIRDVSEARERQVVEWDQSVTLRVPEGRSFGTAFALDWLRRAHEHTHAAAELLLADPTLRNYIDRDR